MFLKLGDSIAFVWQGQQRHGVIIARYGKLLVAKHLDGQEYTVEVANVTSKVAEIPWPGISDQLLSKARSEGPEAVAGQIHDALNALQFLSSIATESQEAAISKLKGPLQYALATIARIATAPKEITLS